jgi:hypothetical protein
LILSAKELEQHQPKPLEPSLVFNFSTPILTVTMSAPHQPPERQTSNQRRKPQRVTYMVLAQNPQRRLAAQRGREFDEDGLNHDDQREGNAIEDSDEESDNESAEDSDDEDANPISQGALAEQLYLPAPVFASDDEEIEDYEEDFCNWEEDFGDEDFDELEELSDQSDDESLTGASSDTEASKEEETNCQDNDSL